MSVWDLLKTCFNADREPSPVTVKHFFLSHCHSNGHHEVVLIFELPVRVPRASYASKVNKLFGGVTTFVSLGIYQDLLKFDDNDL